MGNNKNHLANVDIFNDTLNLIENIDTNSVTTKHNFTEIVSGFNIRQGEISVIPLDTISAAQQTLGRTCVLNMASSKTAGGGVRDGRVAQEECLFRCTNLAETIIQDFYPLSITEGLYTKDAIIIKNSDYEYIEPVSIDCVTVPAIDKTKNIIDDWSVVKHGTGWEINTNYEYNTKMKIKLMLSLAYLNNCDNIILGAWGCGVFKNDPQTIANFFHEILVLEEYKYMFNKVIFAVINDNNSVGNNYEIFKNILS